jgi:hypothetical protein
MARLMRRLCLPRKSGARDVEDLFATDLTFVDGIVARTLQRGADSSVVWK